MTFPDPLVPPEVDLRGYEYMPLYGDRLFKSETWIGASPDAKVAALRLWWHAYAHEVPAASLPNNDVLLSEYAGYGVAVKAWQRIKAQALHGFVECSDGRLYHTRLSEWAIEAWDMRQKERQRKANWRAKKRDKDVTETGTETGTSEGQRRDVPAERKGKERNGEDIKTALERTPGIDARATGSHGRGEKARNGNPVESWSTPAWVTATAQTLGLTRRNGERDDDFADRVHSEVEARQRKAASEARRHAS